MIELEHVAKTFPGQRSPAVTDLSLDVREGEIAVLIGPSGCGKSTTLRMINRLIEPSAGRITVAGNDVLAQKPHELRLSIGYVIQQVGLFPHRTIARNIATVPELLGWDTRAHRRARRRADGAGRPRRRARVAVSRPSCPAGSSSASALRARSPPTRRYC